MLIPILLIIIGFTVLIFGAEILVRGSASLAKKMGIPPIVIGLTVVAFGTSTPELVVNMFSAFNGASDIAIGNIIGSNIANILLILGISALIFPLAVKSNTVWKEIPLALLAVILVYIMGNDAFFDGTDFNALTRTDGLALLAFFAVFMYYIFGISKIEEEQKGIKIYPSYLSVILTLAGIGCLFIGGKLLVDNAIILAELAGLSQAFIGLTIVAVGTSLPELATSVVATIHKHNDIAIGNIVGSNIFNVFWVLGLTGVISQLPFNPATNIDVLVAIGAAFILFIVMFVGKRHTIGKWEGSIFIILYFSYIFYLIQRG